MNGTKIYSSSSGKVTYLDFNGANGYTITIESNNTSFSYSHISANFIVNLGDIIQKGDYIANIGPKYITPISDNPYKDSSGKQTNGLTTGSHLHFSIKIDGKAIDPMILFN